jgi:hypothetical protein
VEAAEIIKRLGSFLDGSAEVVCNLPQTGFGDFLTQLDDRMLQLAVQPDSWGERMRARLMSYLSPALRSDPRNQSVIDIEAVVGIANIVMPCLLLEIGRRAQHIQIGFPTNPMDKESRFEFRSGPSDPPHSISNQHLLQLVAVAGEALVGLCYFGDHESRLQVETELSFQDCSGSEKP